MSNDLIFMLILILIITNVAFLRSLWKEYKQEVEKDKEYYNNL